MYLDDFICNKDMGKKVKRGADGLSKLKLT